MARRRTAEHVDGNEHSVIRRRFAVALVAALVVATISEVSVRRHNHQAAAGGRDAFNFDGSIPGDSAIVEPAPDPRVRWTPYPVGGYGLTNGDTTITIPPGSVLVVPSMVKDSSRSDETT